MSDKNIVKIEFVGNEPKCMDKGSAGNDLKTSEEYFIEPGHTVFVETHTAMAIPEGYFGMAVPRSSLCNKSGLVLANSVGVIDSSYRGTIKFAYRNPTRDPITIEAGERIGQIVIVPFVEVNWVKVDVLPETERGEAGFGSTGSK